MSNSPYNPCSTCGLCCKSYIVPVYGYDIWLLSTRERLSPEQFLVAMPQADPGLDGFKLEPQAPTFGLALDKKGDFDPMNPCVFLLEFKEGHSRCGVYNHRPAVCGTYPVTIWENKLRLMEKRLCPPDAWPDSEVQRPHFRLANNRIYMYADVYHEVVARWNARAARVWERLPDHRFTTAEYFSYVLNVYDRLDNLDAALGPAVMQTLAEEWPTPPRSGIGKAWSQLQTGELPWLDYLLGCRQIIDTFYPDIEAQPLVALRDINEGADTSPSPYDVLK